MVHMQALISSLSHTILILSAIGVTGSNMNEVLYEFPGFLRAYKDGRVERLSGTAITVASIELDTGVQSKDVLISPVGVSARLYIPSARTRSNRKGKLPLLIYFHGGGFVIETAFSPVYHNYCNTLAAKANVVVASIDYRRVPEQLLPVAHDDSWTALNWVASHSIDGIGHEVWLKDYADFERVFFAGDSAGANIAHNMAIRVGSEKLYGIKLVGIVLIHPYFWGKDPTAAELAADHINIKKMFDKLLLYAYPSASSFDDPLINPVLDPKLPSLGCGRVLVCVAEKDVLRDRGWIYYEALGKSGWGGVIDIMESKGENHVFHLSNPTSENALVMLRKVISFINQGT